MNFVNRNLVLLSSFVLCLGTAYAQGKLVTDIQITGNERINRKTLLYYLKVKVGDTLNPEEIDSLLKRLFETQFFQDVHLNLNQSVLQVHVVENKVINQVLFDGNDHVKIDVLSSVIGFGPCDVLTDDHLHRASKAIESIYRAKGYLSAKVNADLIPKDGNRVDVCFKIQEGAIIPVRRIIFLGNQDFSHSQLESLILTKEARWYRVFNTMDSYEPDRINYDKELLRRHYMASGYADFRVISAVGELNQDHTEVFVTFNLHEGPRYKFGKITVESDVIDTEAFEEALEIEGGDWFDSRRINVVCEKFSSLFLEKKLALVDVVPDVRINSKNQTVDVIFRIQSKHPLYVNRLNIQGNTMTKDYVIRNQLPFSEGDVLYKSALQQSFKKLRNLGFFSDIQIVPQETQQNDAHDIEIKVEEQSTGFLSLGMGYATTDGLLGEFSYNERNFLGSGMVFRLGACLSQRTRELSIGWVKPDFLGYNGLTGNVDLYGLSSKQDTRGTFQSGGYKRFSRGISAGIGYQITENFYQSPFIRLYSEEISGVPRKASSFLKQTEGSYLISSIGKVLSYDKRNNVMATTEGYIVSFRSELAGILGDVQFSRNVLSANSYYPCDDDHQFILSFKGQCGVICPLYKPIRLSDRFFLGGQSFRGFGISGLGPRDKDDQDALGGEYFGTGTVEFLFPLPFVKDMGLKGIMLTDWGSVWWCGEKENRDKIMGDEFYLRGSVGIGLHCSWPFGSLRFTWSKPLRYMKDVDIPEVFLIQAGTDF